MKTVKILSRANGRSLPSYEVAPINCTPGCSRDRSSICYHITEVPDDVSDERVARLMEVSVDLTWVSKHDRVGRFTIKYSELGEGKIIR
jgi:hypothetical protein